MHRFIALVLFAFGAALVLGCGNSAPTSSTAPTDKQKQKEQPSRPGSGGAGQKK